MHLSAKEIVSRLQGRYYDTRPRAIDMFSEGFVGLKPLVIRA